IHSSASGTFQSFSGGGSLDNANAGPTISGDVTFNGDVYIGALSSVGGNVNAGGDANLGTNVAGNVVAAGNATVSANIAGNIEAGGNVSVNGLSTVTGNVLSNGDVTVNSTVDGNVNYGVGHSLTVAFGAHVNGSTTSAPASVTPAVFSTVPLPAAHSFTTGSTNVTMPTFATQTLAPGSYNNLTMAGSNTLNLSAGNYYFTNITMNGSFLTLNLNTTGGPINIFVTDSTALHDVTTNINGVGYQNVGPTAIGQVYFETHGSLSVDFSNLVGTFYAPFGDINIKSLSSFTGNVYAGHDVVADFPTFYSGPVSPTLGVPEPASLAIALACVSLLVPGSWKHLHRGRKSPTR
ncbi:MAG TPA: polymer-forming cytoskeletal protein, partial [Gemmataceae bacterium]|nr:polymer-forming cytoskeletal protein [Gemmataceae bacterium]